MRIKHTPTEYYCLYSMLPCKSELFKDVKIWFPAQHYKTKQGALNKIKKIREDKNGFNEKLIFKIVWFPYPFAFEEDAICVYNEDNTNE